MDLIDHDVTHFLQSKLLQKDFSKQSIDAYRSDLDQYLSYLKKNHHIAPYKASLEVIETFISWLSDNDFKPTAISRKISVIRQYYKYLYQQGHIKQNPTRFLKPPKHHRPSIQPLTYDQVTALIAATDQFEHPYNLRLNVLIELAFGAGLRATEVISMSFEAINHDRNYTIITGKGNKERLIPLTDVIKESLEAYLPYRLFFSNGYDSSFLFPSTGVQGHLTRIRFFQLLKELALFANMDPKIISPHIFRHSFAISMLRGGADLHSLQALLGHKNIDTVEIYTKINNQDLWDMVREHHPLNK